MKQLPYILIVLFSTGLLFSCNEEEWLEEVAYDFYSPENSYSTPEQIDIAIVELYQNVHDLMYGSAHTQAFVFQYTTDVGYDAIAPTHELNSWGDKITPESGRVTSIWNSYFKIVANANAILSRIGEVEYPSEGERQAKMAEARFFRAFAYRGLGILFGDLPLLLEEVNSPKRNFVRSPVSEVWGQVITDLTFAADHLPGADAVEQDGRVSKGAANHLLAEIYIITGAYDQAIAAASAVIDDPAYALMTDRFGTRSSEPGDVYWDLFRRGNQNRGSGNTEAIWVSQYEYNTPGGGANDNLARFLVPLYWQLKDNDGKNVFIGPLNQLGGRGIGWWAASEYMLNGIWEQAGNDIRNSEYNIIRDAVVNNPASAYYGQKMIASGAITDFADPLKRWWSAIFAKSAPIGNFPDELIADPETGLTTNSANHTYRDRYIMRLAETYLLRAEAYLLKGDQAGAAADINVVRARANAEPVAAGEADIDLLLDERARELFCEELRLLTIMRMGVNVERVRIHNPMHNGQYADHVINDHQNLWPIPNSEIERNTEAVLEQNPGY
jgi:hypothetical protein